MVNLTPQGASAEDTDRRRVDREEGLSLLFAAAQDVAREEGKLGDGVFATLQDSHISPTSFTLKTPEGRTIARVSLAKAREVIRLRREVARQITLDARVEITPYINDLTNRRKYRNLPEETRALAWAISYGKRFPMKGYERRDIWIGIGLLFLGIIPGVLYLGWIARKRQRYQENLKGLIQRWRATGRQDPAPNLFAHFHLDA